MFTLKYDTYTLTYCMPVIQYINKKLNRGQSLWPAAKWWWISHVWNVVISVGGIFFYRTLCMLHDTKKSWVFSDLVTVISATLPKSFVCSKYAFSVSQFLLYWMQIICCIFKDFVWKLQAFLPSFCHSYACEMSLGWGRLITWMDPSVPGAFERHFGLGRGEFER